MVASLVRGQTVACAHYLVPVEAGRAGQCSRQCQVMSGWCVLLLEAGCSHGSGPGWQPRLVEAAATAAVLAVVSPLAAGELQ